jgi:cysteine synthase A
MGTVDQIVGQTPLIYLKKLSQITGNRIYGKAEFLNPGGSIKDRTALGLIQYYEKSGQLKPGMTLYEGTAGNTGIGLSLLAKSRGYACHIVMPDNQSQEKYAFLKALGATLTLVKPVPFANPNHFYHTAHALAKADPNGIWMDQFENLGNFEIHHSTTGPEIFSQLKGKVDFFGCAAGTGGTIGGVTQFLKSKNQNTQCYLFDPKGSGLFHYFHHKEIKSEGSSVTEGIGIMRLTENFKKSKLDGAYSIDDQSMISMLYYLAKEEGLFVGTSAALNVFGTFQYAIENKGKGLNCVTILCDGGARYQSRVLDPEWLKEKGLDPTSPLPLG